MVNPFQNFDDHQKFPYIPLNSTGLQSTKRHIATNFIQPPPGVLWIFPGHLRIQSFAYWLPIHCIGELGLVWGAMVCSSCLTSAVWIMFRMDVCLGAFQKGIVTGAKPPSPTQPWGNHGGFKVGQKLAK